LAKRIPGAVGFVRTMRRWRDRVAAAVSRVMERRFGTEYWRSHRFDALPGPFALGNHAEESYVVATSDRVIGAKLYSRGTFDLQKLIRAFDIVGLEMPGRVPDSLADVGANVGSICIPALKRGMVKRALAFEPDPGNFRLLRINALLNEVEGRLECHEVALGEAEGSAMLAFNPENHGDHRIVAATGVRVGMRQVQVRTLDSFLETQSEESWLVWLDVQGFEPEVIAGAGAAMKRGWPLVMEFTPDDLVAHGTLEKLVALLAGSPYTRFFDLDSPGASSSGSAIGDLRKLADELSSRGSFTDLLFLPEREA
jgi:FkbM family methyltransferase